MPEISTAEQLDTDSSELVKKVALFLDAYVGKSEVDEESRQSVLDSGTSFLVKLDFALMSGQINSFDAARGINRLNIAIFNYSRAAGYIPEIFRPFEIVGSIVNANLGQRTRDILIGVLMGEGSHLISSIEEKFSQLR